ncbi:hypothetical protein JMA_18640 [Jeotgalibacillus malaysiensis]|uniref:Uncharacterized protein n=1 Tax=Jeotgalibacillus malaysiensis TaxID=1508404 RepID=A0A0B5AM10_9BACL|nr:hypothetical protein JMA_18640 [Jeotgalibacillus malaysiensis]
MPEAEIKSCWVSVSDLLFLITINVSNEEEMNVYEYESLSTS